MSGTRPYRRYAIASLLRGHSEESITKCLRSFGLCEVFTQASLDIAQTQEFTDDIKAYAKASLEDKLALAKKYDVYNYILHAERRWPAWADLWDLMSVAKYREYILVLGSLPSVNAAAIAEAFNTKFSRDISKTAIELLLGSFWDLARMTTAEVKTSVQALTSKNLSQSIYKILYGDAISAAKSVGASLRLNYALILEEMLFEAYYKYKQCVSNKAQAADLKESVNNILKIGDRFDKISKKDTGNDVLHNLLKDLKLESENTDANIDDFMRNNELI